MLVAISAVNELGGELSAFQIIPKLFYPMFLLLASIITIIRSDSWCAAGDRIREWTKNRNFQKTLDLPPYGSCIKQIQTGSWTISGTVGKVRGSTMKIKQVEELVGITRKNIRFYEDQGLLNVERAENGYREYHPVSYTHLDVYKRQRIVRYDDWGW